MDRSDARARFVPEQLLLSVTAAVASAARRPRSHSWDCSALCIYPLEQLHERWEALVRVEPRSQVQARACSSNLDGRTHTSTGRPADGESRTGSRAARQVTRVVTLLRSGRGRAQAARPAWSLSGHKTVPSRGLAPTGKRRSRRRACSAFAS